jgi:hypothetical protein
VTPGDWRKRIEAIGQAVRQAQAPKPEDFVIVNDPEDPDILAAYRIENLSIYETIQIGTCPQPGVTVEPTDPIPTVQRPLLPLVR